MGGPFSLRNIPPNPIRVSSSTGAATRRRRNPPASVLPLRLASPLGSPVVSSELAMGSLATEADLPMAARPKRKPRILCLHGFRTSGEIMKRQVLGKWPEAVTSRLDLAFPDAPFPAEGKSDVEGIFPPPYYEWFQFDKPFMEYTNLDECLKYIEDLMIERGPFDGFMGFSQGAILSAALPGMQAKGAALTRVPKVKFVVIISGIKFRSPTVQELAYSDDISCPSLHFLGEKDFLKPEGEVLLESYVEPTVIHHPKGHTFPRLDDKSLETVMRFIKRVEEDVAGDHTN